MTLDLTNLADPRGQLLQRHNTMLQDSNYELQDEVTFLTSELREVQESMLAIADRFDNIGWNPLTKKEDPTEMTLDTVKKVSELARGLYSVNPFVHRGVDARKDYIWGKGVSFDGIEDVYDEIEANRKRIFSPQAYEELERVLATDGNAFLALPIDTSKQALRIPLHEIHGAVYDPEDSETTWFYKRSYMYYKTDGRNGNVDAEERTVYYMSTDYYRERLASGKRMPATWQGKEIAKGYVMHHMAVNKQVGWHWGVPDVLPVIFWAKAYKEYLEDNATLVKAYSRLAWSAKASTGAGAGAVAAQLQRGPMRDPITGESKDVGGTSINGGGVDLQPLPPTGSQVDFNKGSALASAIAAGLGVSKVIILSDPGEGNRSAAETLDGPMLKAMEARQKIHEERFLDIFSFWGLKVSAYGQVQHKLTEASEAEGDDKKPKEAPKADFASVSWPQIESDSTKDRLTALTMGVEAYILFPEEARKEALDVLGISPFRPWDELPEKPEPPVNPLAGGDGSVVPAQGKGGGIAAKGGNVTDPNEARDNRKKDEGK